MLFRSDPAIRCAGFATQLTRDFNFPSSTLGFVNDIRVALLLSSQDFAKDGIPPPFAQFLDLGSLEIGCEREVGVFACQGPPPAVGSNSPV